MAPARSRLDYLGANIRRLRMHEGWTQEELAEAASLDVRYLRTLESTRANPRADVLVRIAAVLGVGLGPLFRATRIPERRPGRPRRPPPAHRR